LVLSALHRDEEFVRESIELAASKRPLSVSRYPEVAVSVVNGGVALVERTPYMIQPRPSASKPGPARAVGNRGPSGSGCYPVLARLGFLGRTSPVVTSTVARAATELGSYAEARASLGARGMDLDFKGVRLIAHRVADAGLEARYVRAVAPETRELDGKRVVVTFDGGRVRTRVSGKRGRRRAKTGRRGYKTPWREPALLAIYVVDKDGKKAAERPWYEATLDGWDALFVIARDLLRHLGVRYAREVVFAADGSSIIWDRIGKLIGELGLEENRVHRFADFWHAVEHLHDVVEKMGDRWSAEEAARWVRARRRQLFDGHTDIVIAEIRKLAVGRGAPEISAEANYFEERKHLMRYPELRAAKLPIGTGAVESAIRRVVNLRMKGAGTFWEDENAERMLLLRCRLKSGRWDELEKDVYAFAGALQGRTLKIERQARRQSS
jgi:hypothetical protein